MAITTLAQLRTKRDQIVELDTAITAKINDEAEFEEEIDNADIYQLSLEERIAILTQFIRKAGIPPPPVVTSLPVLPPTSAVDTLRLSDPATTRTEPVHVRPSDTHTHMTQ